jgi:hypothetical protein
MQECICISKHAAHGKILLIVIVQRFVDVSCGELSKHAGWRVDILTE